MLIPKETSLARFRRFLEFLFTVKVSWRKISAYISLMPCKLLFLLLMELSLATGGYAQQGQVGIADRPATTRNNLKVFDSLCNNISERYFDPKFNGADWDKLEQKHRPLAAVADSTESLITVLRQMVAELKTTHLEVSLRIDPKVVQQKIGQRIAIKRDLIWLNAGFQLKSISQ